MSETSGARHPSLVFRAATEGDHARVIGAIPEWWQTPNSATLPLLLPRLFFQHFGDTSTIVEDGNGELAAFLVGFRSQSLGTPSRSVSPPSANPIARWNACDRRLTGPVIASTRRQPSARICAKKRS